jgi:hypothetical protein
MDAGAEPQQPARECSDEKAFSQAAISEVALIDWRNALDCGMLVSALFKPGFGDQFARILPQTLKLRSKFSWTVEYWNKSKVQ